MAENSYEPPTPEEMQGTQNGDPALQLLVAQRLTYTKAKRYLIARLVGMLLIAVVAPIAGAIWSNVAVLCGAAAGLWIFAGRTTLTTRQLNLIDQAAALQEKFDALVFAMPDRAEREHMPSLEDIDKLVGSRTEVKRSAQVEKLRDWYPFTPGSDPCTSVAACQRANVSYSDSLLRTTARIWRLCVLAWAVVALALSLALHASVADLLLIVALPLLPAFLDIVEFTRNYDSASHSRRTTAGEIEDVIVRGRATPSASQLLVWQERIYELRRTTPLVPDVVYWLHRKKNERAMNTVATQLTK